MSNRHDAVIVSKSSDTYPDIGWFGKVKISKQTGISGSAVQAILKKHKETTMLRIVGALVGQGNVMQQMKDASS